MLAGNFLGSRCQGFVLVIVIKSAAEKEEAKRNERSIGFFDQFSN